MPKEVESSVTYQNLNPRRQTRGFVRQYENCLSSIIVALKKSDDLLFN